MFCFYPILYHPHTQIRIINFHDVQRDIPKLEFSPSHVSIKFSQVAFPTTVLPEDDRTDFAQEEGLGLPYWTMILGHLCRGRRIQMSEHSDLGIFNINEKVLHQLLVLRVLAIWTWCSWLFPLSFGKLMILVRWIRNKNLNRLSQSPRSTTRPLCFWCFASNSAFFRWQMSINDAKWTVAPDVLASSITCFLLLTFVKIHAEIFSNFSHSLSTAAFAAGFFIVWGMRMKLNRST